ncbi:MAG: YggT family protein [Rhodoluna sp.]|nr:YggT family protein [Rhodoluna sp.]MBP6186450.1 YggT family protein [Rhodoluna sp.]
MSVLVVALWWALQLYFYLLIARFVIDLVLSINPTWRPRGLVLVATEVVMTLTDPPLRLVRKFIKPVRVGSISLDFGWTLLLLLVSLLQNALARIV